MIVASATSPNWKKRKEKGFFLAKKFAPVVNQNQKQPHLY